MAVRSRRWGIELFLLSFVQILLFATAFVLVYLALDFDYVYTLVVGVPVFSIIVSLNNLFAILARSRRAEKAITLVAVIVHSIMWGEDLSTVFFLSAVTGILIGGTVILARSWIIDRLGRIPPLH